MIHAYYILCIFNFLEIRNNLESIFSKIYQKDAPSEISEYFLPMLNSAQELTVQQIIQVHLLEEITYAANLIALHLIVLRLHLCAASHLTSKPSAKPYITQRFDIQQSVFSTQTTINHFFILLCRVSSC